jgi:hypothetical protein
VRWYDSGRATKVSPHSERYWIRTAREPDEVGGAMRGMQNVA